ncbi:MAG: hypothetical protein AAFX06_24950 [Planctomycetota bacterium]
MSQTTASIQSNAPDHELIDRNARPHDTAGPFVRYVFGVFGLMIVSMICAASLVNAFLALATTMAKPTVLGELIFLRWSVISFVAVRITLSLGQRVLGDQTGQVPEIESHFEEENSIATHR